MKYIAVLLIALLAATACDRRDAASPTTGKVDKPKPTAVAPPVTPPGALLLPSKWETMFWNARIRDSRRPALNAVVNRATANRPRYQTVAGRTSVPWFVIACIHSLEASQSWTRHLHNGDPLTGRTFQVPKGRPPASVGNPPFTWEVSAEDALRYDRLADGRSWDLHTILYSLEGYNGWGYKKKGLPSPYLWSFTDQYTKGKYVADGRYDPNAVSAQAGAAAIILSLMESGHLQIPQPSKIITP